MLKRSWEESEKGSVKNEQVEILPALLFFMQQSFFLKSLLIERVILPLNSLIFADNFYIFSVYLRNLREIKE